MKFFLGFFSTPDRFSILPALTLRVMRCEDPNCGAIHGYELGLHWAEWGIGGGVEFHPDEPDIEF
jgi:hypothetical protein